MLGHLIDSPSQGVHLNHIDLLNICITDERALGPSAGRNRQNDREWCQKGDFNPYEPTVLQERAFQGPKTCVSVLVHARTGIIGPFLVDCYMNPDDPRDKI